MYIYSPCNTNQTCSFTIQLIRLSKTEGFGHLEDEEDDVYSLEDDIWGHLGGVALKSIQETFANEVRPTMTTKMDLEVFANELVESVQGKSVYEVIYIHRYIHLHHGKQMYINLW